MMELITMKGGGWSNNISQKTKKQWNWLWW
jgi:hypothetical protein